MTICSDLPSPGIDASVMFYFNIYGSMNKKDVKLVAFISNSGCISQKPNKCVYFDNDVAFPAICYD